MDKNRKEIHTKETLMNHALALLQRCAAVSGNVGGREIVFIHSRLCLWFLWNAVLLAAPNTTY